MKTKAFAILASACCLLGHGSPVPIRASAKMPLSEVGIDLGIALRNTSRETGRGLHGYLARIFLTPRAEIDRAQENPAPQDEPRRDWWYWAMAASVQESAGQWAAAAENWARAAEAEPKYARGWYQTGIARSKAGLDGAQEALENSSEFDQVRAAAFLALTELHADNGEHGQAEAAAQAALEAGLSMGRKDLLKRKQLASIRSLDWYPAFERHVTAEPLARMKRMADAGDHEGLVQLILSLTFFWRGEDLAPVALVHQLLGDVVDAAADKNTETKLSAVSERARVVGRAADEAFRTDVFSPWVEAIVRLNKTQRVQYLENWSALDGLGAMFRGHRFRALMKMLLPIEASTRSMGDTYGQLLALGALLHTRECLVEYKVSGYDLTAEWVRAWKGMQEYGALAKSLGEHEEVSSFYEDHIYLINHYPKGEKVRLSEEFKTLQGVPQTLIELTLMEHVFPMQDRQIKWTKNWLRDWGLCPK